VNATFVLLTAAWLTGQAPATQQPAQPAGQPAAQSAAPLTAKPNGPAVIATPLAGGYGGCCNTCNTCDCCEESWGSKMMGKLRGMFSRKNDCCDDCGADPCDPCCDGKVKGWWGNRVKRDHGDDCCGCGGYAGHGVSGAVITPLAPAKPAEQIPAPSGAKELPKGEKTGAQLTPRPFTSTSPLAIR
jgi:hypothetical protein